MQLRTKTVTALALLVSMALPLHAAQPTPLAGTMQDAQRHATPRKAEVKKRAPAPTSATEPQQSRESSSQRVVPAARPLRKMPTKRKATERVVPKIPLMPPSITYPADGSEVDPVFAVAGKGSPGHVVKVKTSLHFTMNDVTDVVNDAETKQVTVGSDGSWRIAGFRVPKYSHRHSNIYLTIYATEFFPDNKTASAPVVSVRFKAPETGGQASSWSE